MPRDKETGKPKGFSFVMYEDQRSTVLAVDNLNGATVLGRTLRVDHVKNYKQPKIKNEDGEWIEPEERSMNAKPEIIEGHLSTIPRNPKLTLNAVSEAESKSSVSTGASIDPEDPMRDYLIAKRREAKAKSKAKRKHKDETPEERRARKLRKKEKREKRLQSSSAIKGVEELLNNLSKRDRSGAGNVLERSGHRSESRMSISPRRHGRSRSRDRSASGMDYRGTERSRYLGEREPHDPYERHSRRS